MSYPNSEKCTIRSLKRRTNRDYPPDQQIKMSRHSFLPRINGLQSFQRQTSQLMEYSDTDTSQITLHSLCHDAYSLPVKKIPPVSLDSKWLIPPLNDQVSESGNCKHTVQNKRKISEDMNLAHFPVISQRNQQELCVSRPLPVKQCFRISSASASSDISCQKCAAGQPGHIQHIGQWRVMDSIGEHSYFC